MAVLDWIRREIVIIDRGRRFVCRPPSLAAVLIVLGDFDEALRTLHEEATEAAVTWDAGMIERTAAVLTDDPRSVATLLRCVTLEGGAPGALETALIDEKSGPRLRLQLALAVLSMCDLARIGGAMFAGAPTPEAEDDDAVTGLDTLIAAVSAGQHLHPLDVAELPYETWLTLRAIYTGESGETSGESLGELASWATSGNR